MIKNKEFIGHLFAFLCIVIWGTSFIVSKRLMHTVTPIQLMWIRFILAYLMLWVLHPVWHFHWKEEGLFLLVSLFGNTLNFLAENTALYLTQASNVSILVSTSPIITAILLHFFFHGESFPPRKIVGFGAAFLGVVLVVLNGRIRLHLHPAGDLLALSASLCWSIYGILVRKCNDKFNSFLITRKLMFYGIVTSTPLLLVDNPIHWDALFTWENMIGLLYLGFICSALCYLMWNHTIKWIGTLKTTIYMYAVPLITTLAGILFLKETITFMGACGMFLILTGMALATLSKNQKFDT